MRQLPALFVVVETEAWDQVLSLSELLRAELGISRIQLALGSQSHYPEEWLRAVPVSRAAMRVSSSHEKDSRLFLPEDRAHID